VVRPQCVRCARALFDFYKSPPQSTSLAGGASNQLDTDYRIDRRSGKQERAFD
jgi:hypothetical protein